MSSAAATAPIRQVPRLVRDALYAPQCPTPAVAALVEVALTHHNAGRFEEAVAAYEVAERAWESALLAVTVADSGLTALAREMEEKPWLLTGEPDPATLADPNTTTHSSNDDGEDGTNGETGDEPTTNNNAAAALEPVPTTSRLDAFAAVEREENLEKLRAIYAERSTVVPAEHKIFLRLAVGGVYSSAQQDADALALYGEAKRLLLTGVPVYYATLLAANVYAALGAVHYHLSQFDFAGDYFFRCLESREQLCGVTHADTAAAMNNVGAALYMLGKSADALLLFNKAAEIVQAQFPVAHPRRDTVELNVRIAKGTFFTDASFPSIPFTPYTVPMCPGAKAAARLKQPAAKKPAAKAGDAKKGKK